GSEVGDRPAHAFIPQSNLGSAKAEDRERRAITRFFHGEQALMEKIQMLSEKGKKPIVYFTQFNGELEIENQMLVPPVWQGGGVLRSKLRKDNYDVRGLIWGSP